MEVSANPLASQNWSHFSEENRSKSNCLCLIRNQKNYYTCSYYWSAIIGNPCWHFKICFSRNVSSICMPSKVPLLHLLWEMWVGSDWIETARAGVHLIPSAFVRHCYLQAPTSKTLFKWDLKTHSRVACLLFQRWFTFFSQVPAKALCSGRLFIFPPVPSFGAWGWPAPAPSGFSS